MANSSVGGSLCSNSTLFMSGNRWHQVAGREAFYFGTDGRNYYRGGTATTIPHTWRRGDDTNILSVTNEGNVRANGSFTNIGDTRIKKDILDIDDTIG